MAQPQTGRFGQGQEFEPHSGKRRRGVRGAGGLASQAEKRQRTGKGSQRRGTQADSGSSECLLIRNMVGPGELSGSMYDDIAEELISFGHVTCATAHEVEGGREEEAVRIFVRYDAKASAKRACVSLHLRRWHGRTLDVSYFPLSRFISRELEPRTSEPHIATECVDGVARGCAPHTDDEASRRSGYRGDDSAAGQQQAQPDSDPLVRSPGSQGAAPPPPGDVWLAELPPADQQRRGSGDGAPQAAVSGWVAAQQQQQQQQQQPADASAAGWADAGSLQEPSSGPQWPCPPPPPPPPPPPDPDSGPQVACLWPPGPGSPQMGTPWGGALELQGTPRLGSPDAYAQPAAPVQQQRTTFSPPRQLGAPPSRRS